MLNPRRGDKITGGWTEYVARSCGAHYWQSPKLSSDVSIGQQSARVFGRILRAACGRLFVTFSLHVTARDLMLIYPVTGNEPLDRIRNLYSVKSAISEKTFANSHESFVQMKVWVHVELSVVLESNFVLCDLITHMRKHAHKRS